MPDLDRTNILQLLDRLGSADDADVLAAARELHRSVSEAGVGWDALLVRDDGPAEPADHGGADAGDDAAPAEPPDPPRTLSAAEAADDLALIETMLARPELSEMTREDLVAYKDDIANGEFTDQDRRYLRELHGRLSARR